MRIANPRAVSQDNYLLLGWHDAVIPARLLGVAHQTLRRWAELPHAAPAPSIFAGALAQLPPEIILEHLTHQSWAIRRVKGVIDPVMVWQWRATLCALAAAHALP